MPTTEETDVSIEKDVVFGSAGQRELLCDVYSPPPAKRNGAAIVHVHGGGGNGGSKDGARLALAMASLGYVSVATQYRLAGEALWPAQLHDIKACIRWTRANAERLGIDDDKVAIFGYSIGGQFAMIAAGSQNDPQLEGESGTPGTGTQLAACIVLYPSARTDSGSLTVLGEGNRADLDSVDPLAYIREGFPPTALLHGNADTIVDVKSSFDLYAALAAANVPAELHVIEGVNHSFEAYPELAAPAAAFIDLFLSRHVVDPRSYRERRR